MTLTDKHDMACRLPLPCFDRDCKRHRKEWAVTGAGGRHSTLQRVWPLLDEPARLLCPTADNGHLTAESSTLVFDADAVERQEKASLAPLFNWAGALLESQQHAMHWPWGAAVATQCECLCANQMGVRWVVSGYVDKVSPLSQTTVSDHKHCKHSQEIGGALLQYTATRSSHDSIWDHS